MKAELGKRIILGLIGVLMLVGMAACTPQPGIELAVVLTPQPAQPTAVASTHSVETNTPQAGSTLPAQTPAASNTPTLFNFPTPQVDEAVFDISATNFRLDEDQVKIDVCFNLPDQQDWMLDRARLQLGALTLDQTGGELLEYEQATSQGKPGRRCDTFYFEAPLNSVVSEAILTIESVSAPPREGQYCEFLLSTVQPFLDQRGAGIKVSCTEQTGYSDAKVISKPDDMTQAEAEQIAFSREYYRVDGPWQFRAEGIPTATPFPTAAVDDPDADPYALLRTLNQIADASVTYPGWVYLQENWQHDIDPDHLLGKINGGYMPKSYQRETWLRLDENRKVIQSVSLLKDLSGSVLETVVFSDGISMNKTTQESYTQNPYRFHFNEPFFGNLQANLEQGSGSALRGELDGRAVFQFTIDEKFVNNDPNFYAQPVVGDQVTAYLDPASGQLRQLQTVATLADGSQRRLEWMHLQASSLNEPPQAVLDLLAKMNLP